jgi:DNA-binding transcriptional regulator YiaG
VLSLGEFIANRRESLGYTKTKFSKLIGVGDDTLRSWERNRFVPAGINARNLVKILNFSNEEIRKYFKGWIWPAEDHQNIQKSSQD